MPGPAPQEEVERRNKSPRLETIKADGAVRGWDLPEKVLGVNKNGRYIKWHPMTRKWWEAWRSSPQSTRMLSEPDWYFLLDTALMHHSMWANRQWEYASEIRLRVAKFGATPEDRLRLRLAIETQEDASVGNHSGANVTSLTDRKARMRSAG